MKIFRVGLIIFFAIAINPIFASEDSGTRSTFQKYFASMRQCLNSDNVATCLPLYIDSQVSKPGPNYTRDEFVNLVLRDPSFKDHVSSCFEVSAEIIMEYADTKLFRSKNYACQAIKIDGKWQLTQFYNFYSGE